MRTLLLAALVLVVLMALFRLALPWLVAGLVYYPEPLDPRQGDPRDWGHEDAEELWLTTADGVRLHAWWFPTREELCGVAVFLHGNAGNLVSRGPIAESLAYLGFHVLVPDYRGFGLSEGRPEEEGLYQDGEAAWEAALERSGLGPERLLLMGNSLGSAVAAEVAVRRPVGGLVLVNPFASTVSVGRHAYRFLPDWYLDWRDHRYETVPRISRTEAPLLVVRAGADRLIPEADSRAVYEAAAGPALWHEEEDADHNDVLARQGPWLAIRDFAREHICPGPAT